MKGQTIAEKIKIVEKLRQLVRHNDMCMDYYNELKEYNKGDRMYGWLFENDNILDEDLEELVETYIADYSSCVLQAYINELENILIKGI